MFNLLTAHPSEKHQRPVQSPDSVAKGSSARRGRVDTLLLVASASVSHCVVERVKDPETLKLLYKEAAATDQTWWNCAKTSPKALRAAPDCCNKFESRKYYFCHFVVPWCVFI